MPTDLLPTCFKTGTWLLNKSNIVQWWKCALLFLCFYKFWRAIYIPLLTVLIFFYPIQHFPGLAFVPYWRKKGTQMRGQRKPRLLKIWDVRCLSQCINALRFDGIYFESACLAVEASALALWSSGIVKCSVMFMTARLILRDWIYKKYRALWLWLVALVSKHCCKLLFVCQIPIKANWCASSSFEMWP